MHKCSINLKIDEILMNGVMGILINISINLNTNSRSLNQMSMGDVIPYLSD